MQIICSYIAHFLMICSYIAHFLMICSYIAHFLMICSYIAHFLMICSYIARLFLLLHGYMVEMHTGPCANNCQHWSEFDGSTPSLPVPTTPTWTIITYIKDIAIKTYNYTHFIRCMLTRLLPAASR